MCYICRAYIIINPNKQIKVKIAKPIKFKLVTLIQSGGWNEIASHHMTVVLLLQSILGAWPAFSFLLLLF